jgi:hypothetical protein
MSAIYEWTQTDQFAPSSLAICCPRCECAMTLHQPDPELPDRLLATCDDCKSWFLADTYGAVLIPLREFPNVAIPWGSES